jgi:predicted amidohydrolase
MQIPQSKPETHLSEMKEIGENLGLGNLLGIQPYMLATDFSSEEAYFNKLDTYLAECQKRNWLNSKTIIVFPEFLGSWLVAAQSPAFTFLMPNTTLAMIPIVLKNFITILKYLFKSPAQDRIKYALFRTQAQNMATIYHSVFSKLALKYKVGIVAGSIVLPPIEITNDSILVRDGPLYNTTVFYYPDGTPFLKPILKIYPTPEELPFTQPADISTAIPVIPTEAGLLGILICADSWYPEPYLELKRQGATLLAVPSFVGIDGDVSAPWRCNNITPPPPEFESSDFLKITYDDAWIKYTTPARVNTANIKWSMNTFLRGRFWELGSDGHSIIMADGKLHRGSKTALGAIQNLWIG